MERFDNLEIAKKLVSQEINRLIEMWAQDPNGKAYLVRFCDIHKGGFSIQPTYSDVFYGIEKFFDIAKACDISVYIDIDTNKAGVSCPTLNFH